jgi:serine/threonine protein kinase
MTSCSSLCLDFLSTSNFPAQFCDFLLAKEDLEFQNEIPCCGMGKAYLVKYKGSDLVLKTVLDNRGLANVYPAYASLVTSLLSLRFYFLAPIQGFTAAPPLGICYSSYTSYRPLSTYLVSPALIPPTNRALIAAFVAYGMAYLEFNQLLHGSLHSGNIFLTDSFIPIITDYGLSRGYDFFRDPTRCDQIAWIAPEMLLLDEVNYSIDVYAYGILLFEMFEGRRPFEYLSNAEYLLELKAGHLDSLDFKATPSNWHSIIRRCTDRTPLRRPTFIDIYQNIKSGQYSFPGIDTAKFKAVLAQYPIQRITGAETPPPPLNVDYVSGADILSDPNHPQFVEYVQYLGITIPVDAVDAFSAAVSRFVGRGQSDQSLVRFLLSAVAAVCQQGPEFRKRVFQSPFFKRLHITTVAQSDLLLEILLPVFTTSRDLIGRPLYESIALLFVFHPTEALNIFSRYVKDTKTFNQPFWDVIHVYVGLWPLFCGSTSGGFYLRVLAHLYATSPDFQKTFGREVIAIVSRFQRSKRTFLAASLFTIRFAIGALSVPPSAQLRLARDSENWAAAASVLLRVPSLAASAGVAAALAARLHECPDRRTFAIVLRFARAGEAHARLLMAAQGWFDAASPESSFLVLLAIFGFPNLRAEIGRQPEFFANLIAICTAESVTVVHSVCSLLQRVDVTPEYVALASKSGLLAHYLRVTLEASATTVVKFGIVCVDVYARVGYAEEWLYTLAAVIQLLKTRYHEFGEEVIAVMSTLSAYPPCLAVMREQGLVEYYQELLAYEKYAEYARFFLRHAAQ